MSWVFGSFIRHIIAPQAHFRKVTVHVVGKSGCVLHARATRLVGMFGEL